MIARVFFKTTEDALRNITKQFDLVHPLRTSMQYTRNVMRQMATENPNADDDYYKSVFDPDIRDSHFR